jgi:hypothetical protein
MKFIRRYIMAMGDPGELEDTIIRIDTRIDTTMRDMFVSGEKPAF